MNSKTYALSFQPKFWESIKHSLLSELSFSRNISQPRILHSADSASVEVFRYYYCNNTKGIAAWVSIDGQQPKSLVIARLKNRPTLSQEENLRYTQSQFLGPLRLQPVIEEVSMPYKAKVRKDGALTPSGNPVSFKGDVYIIDNLPPEDVAMLQALYSRSTDSVMTHLKRLEKTGSNDFMAKFYVGYGHESIGQCGVTTLFFEGISLLAAKALQDSGLYNGQETSTRYVDFTNQRIVDPVDSKYSSKIQKDYMDFISKSMPGVVDHLKKQFPNTLGSDSYEGAIKSRAFDILRGFLPAGITTQASWSTSISNAKDRLNLLKNHPLEELREISKKAYAMLADKYPSSFSTKPNPDKSDYEDRYSEYFNYQKFPHVFDEDHFHQTCSLAPSRIPTEILTSRPKGAHLPKKLGYFGTFNLEFILDFGSFRDIQRHRNGFCLMPLLTSNLGFNSWYMSQLPAAIKKEAQSLLRSQLRLLETMAKVTPETDMQYYYPLGFNVVCALSYGIPEMVYVTELRSSTTVHPILRECAHKMHRVLTRRIPGIAMYTDLSEDTLCVRRGSQNIEEKPIPEIKSLENSQYALFVTGPT